MTSPKSKEQVVPEDIFQTACGIVMEAKSLKSMLRHKDVVDAIATAILAERERCNSDVFKRLELAFRCGAIWQYINGDGKKLGTAEGLNKEAYDYADYETSALPTPPKGGEE